MGVLAAVTVKQIRISTVVLCALLILLGLMVTIALALSSKTAGGRCWLYADRTDFGPTSVCSYIYAVTCLFHMVTCVARAGLTAVVIARLLDWEELLSNKAVVVTWAIVDVMACVLTLVTCGLASQGFSAMCSKLFYPHSDRCGTTAVYSVASNSFVTNYHTPLNIAQAGLWLSWILWILLVMVDVLLMWKDGILSELQATLRPTSAPHSTSASGMRSGGAVSRDRANNESQRSRVALFFRSGDSDNDSGPRTPPPQRPVPPRPPVPAAAAGAKRY